MSSQPLPRLPIPEPLRGTEIPSFTNYSIAVRLPDIARRVITENELIPDNLARMQALIAEIPSGKVRPLENPLAPDAPEWLGYIEPYLGWDWLHVPWFFAEAYFYARILEATGYYRPGPGKGMDPFILQKRLGLETSLATARTLSARVNQAVGSAERRGWQAEDLLYLLGVDLWGNQIDLSLWPAAHGEAAGESAFQGKKERVLVDDSHRFIQFFAGEPRRRVDFLLDNAGFELVCDLALADYLLQSGLAREINFHVKAQPTFVSDALIKDVLKTVEHLESDPNREMLQMAGRLQAALSAGRLVLREDSFWTSPLPNWEMPTDLRQELGNSDLIVSKGDANYRRMLGDRHWTLTAPLSEILNYLPAPVLLLRTLKSEIAAGLASGTADAAARVDEKWMIDGQWGLIQLVH